MLFFQENSVPSQSRIPCGSYLILMFSDSLCVPRAADLCNGSSDRSLTVWIFCYCIQAHTYAYIYIYIERDVSCIYWPQQCKYKDGFLPGQAQRPHFFGFGSNWPSLCTASETFPQGIANADQIHNCEQKVKCSLMASLACMLAAHMKLWAAQGAHGERGTAGGMMAHKFADNGLDPIFLLWLEHQSFSIANYISSRAAVRSCETRTRQLYAHACEMRFFFNNDCGHGPAKCEIFV